MSNVEGGGGINAKFHDLTKKGHVPSNSYNDFRVL